MIPRGARVRLLIGVLAATVLLYFFGEGIWGAIVLRMTDQRTVGDVVEAVGPSVESRLRPYFGAATISYPPTDIALIGLKAEKRLELWARDASSEAWRHVRDYPVLGASGVAGPKLREGDGQVPEGLYRIVALNPNSRFYLSMKLDYPNEFDRARGADDGRAELGGDIFIHGKTASIGCLAMGDEAIEELFVLVVRTGMERVRVVLAPQDLRKTPEADTDGLPRWSEGLYTEIREALAAFPLQLKTGTGS